MLLYVSALSSLALPNDVSRLRGREKMSTLVILIVISRVAKPEFVLPAYKYGAVMTLMIG